ncbi:MAG: pitrilysin family protein [bacterium]
MNTQRIVTAILFICALFLCSFALAQKHPRELPEPKPLSFKPTKPVQFTVANGIQVYYFEDKNLPLISLNAIFKGGGLYESQEKAGLASMTGSIMRTGGTKTLTGDQMDEELEFLAASVSSNMGDEYANVRANCLTKDFKRVLELFADVIMNPEFRQDKIDLEKNQAKESIRRRWEQPASTARLLFSDQMFGGTPYGYRTTFKSLNSITREDLRAFHARFFAPNNMTISIVGDISQADAKKMLEQVFKSWLKTKVDLPEISKLTEKADGTVYYAQRETPQASMVLGHLGVKRGNPDEFKLSVMNDMFGGGGFTARLMKEIRSNRGLTYGIYGGVQSGRDRGLFQVSSQLKAAKFVEAITLVKDIIKDMQNNPVPDEELTLSKKSLINSFVFQFESKASIAQQTMMLKLNGYPDNYLDTYVENISKVTKKDIQDVAKKYMDLDKMMLVVVGNDKMFDKPLSTLGKVKEIDYKKIAEEEKAEK